MNIELNHSKWKEYNFNDIFTEYSKNNTENLEQFTVGKYGLTTKLTDTCSYNIKNHKVFEPNTLLIGIGAEEVGVSVTEQGCVSPIYSTFKISNNFDSLFLKYLMPIIILQNKYKISHISTRRDYEIETSKLSKIKILLPSFEIQKEISRLLSLVDNKIENQDRTLTKLKQLKQSLLRLLFPSNNNNYPQLRFKNFTSPWEQRKFEDFCTIVTKQTGFDYTATIKKSLIQESSEDSFPYLQTKNFTGTTIDYNTDYYIPQKIAREFPKINLNEKCVLFSIVGASVGNIGLFPGNKHCFLSGAICVSKFIDETDADYLYHFMCSTGGQSQIKTCTKGGAQATITIEDIRNFDVKTPSKNERDKIGKFLNTLDNLITLHQCKCI